MQTVDDPLVMKPVESAPWFPDVARMGSPIRAACRHVGPVLFSVTKAPVKPSVPPACISRPVPLSSESPVLDKFTVVPAPEIVTPVSVTLIEYCLFGLVNVPENGVPSAPFVPSLPFAPLHTYAVVPVASVIAAPPAAQWESPAATCATVGLCPGSPGCPFWLNVIAVSIDLH